MGRIVSAGGWTGNSSGRRVGRGRPQEGAVEKGGGGIAATAAVKERREED